MKTFNQYVTRFLIVSLCFFQLPFGNAQAEMIATYNLAGAGQADSTRQRLQHYLTREDVRTALVANGVDPAAASARVDALSDDELAAVAGKIDTLPAGGDFIGVLVFVFVLLLVTDILGFTKVYNFTRPIRK